MNKLNLQLIQHRWRVNAKDTLEIYLTTTDYKLTLAVQRNNLLNH